MRKESEKESEKRKWEKYDEKMMGKREFGVSSASLACIFVLNKRFVHQKRGNEKRDRETERQNKLKILKVTGDRWSCVWE